MRGGPGARLRPTKRGSPGAFPGASPRERRRDARRDLVLEPVVLLDGASPDVERLGPFLWNDRSPSTEARHTGRLAVGRAVLQPGQPVAVSAETSQHEAEVQLVPRHEVQDAPDVLVVAAQDDVRTAGRRLAAGPDG